MQIVSNGDNLHEMSNPEDISCKLSQFAWNVKSCFLWKNKKNNVNLSSAEYACRVINVKGIVSNVKVILKPVLISGVYS